MGLNPVELARFESKLERVTESGCWIWIGVTNAKGYGHFRPQGKTMRSAHRLAYEHFRGPIPDGLHIDHLCRVRCCVNPDHLEPVTPKENTRRSPIAVCAVKARRLTCKNGHALTMAPAHTYYGARGWRECRPCKRVYQRNKERQRRQRAREARLNAGW